MEDYIKLILEDCFLSENAMNDLLEVAITLDEIIVND